MVLALAGCGFTPALGPGGPAQGLIGHVRAAEPKEAFAYEFVKRVEERLDRAEPVLYDLAYDITTSSDGVGITADGAITRYNLSGQVVWVLTRRADGLRMDGGTVSNFASYSATGSTVAGLKAREDAEARLMSMLADQVVAALLAGAAGWPK